MEEEKKTLLGMTATELRGLAASLGMPAFVGGQVAQWLYRQRVRCFDEMRNISKANREKLEAACQIGAREPDRRVESADGTVKYLFPTASGKHVETVFIPEGDRATVCVSSQVGCKMGCLFCQTGRQGFEGHLTAADILNQIHCLPQAERVTNVVFMGQGEPLDNLDSVLRATEAMTAPWGWAWSPKRITVSTVGLRGKLKRFLDESQCHLAVSMHSPQHEQRKFLMPAERGYAIADVVELLRQYDFTHQRRLSFEYTMFGGLNDSLKNAQDIVNLVRGMECRVNLIRFHRIPDAPLADADEERMTAFRDYLTSHGVFATIRASRGQDIFAACGMLTTQAGVERGGGAS